MILTGGVNGDKRLSVLVADHNRWTRQSLATMLDDAGLSVSEASNGFSALRLALELAPQIVILGPELPEMGTAQLTERLRSDPATRHTAIVGVHDGVDADASLTLPCDTIPLLATVVNALEVRRQELAAAAAPIRSVTIALRVLRAETRAPPTGTRLCACRPNARTPTPRQGCAPFEALVFCPRRSIMQTPCPDD